MQTFSRGGLVSWIAAVCFVMWRRVRECGWSRRVVVIVGTVLLVFASCMDQGLSRRMAFGLSGDDRSVVNRFDIWSKVPQMIHDAPWGWGLGNSGSAYMNWYQPLGRFERYRTLVNSHLTWAVETGWVGLFAWLVMWGGIIRFNCCVGMRFSRWLCFAAMALSRLPATMLVSLCWLLWLPSLAPWVLLFARAVTLSNHA